MSKRGAVVLLTLATVLALVGAVAAVIVLSPHTAIRLGDTNGLGQARVTLAILLAGAVQAVCLVAVMVALGWADWLAERRLSPVYWPMLTVKVGIMVTLLITGASAFGMLYYDFRPPWRWLNEPEVRLASALGLAVTVAGMAWLAAVLLNGRGWRCRWVLVLYALQTGVTLVIVGWALWA